MQTLIKRKKNVFLVFETGIKIGPIDLYIYFFDVPKDECCGEFVVFGCTVIWVLVYTIGQQEDGGLLLFRRAGTTPLVLDRHKRPTPPQDPSALFEPTHTRRWIAGTKRDPHRFLFFFPEFSLRFYDRRKNYHRHRPLAVDCAVRFLEWDSHVYYYYSTCKYFIA